MAEHGFFTADENDFYRRADQLILIDYALQLPIAWKLFDLACHNRDLSSIVAHRFDPDPVTCLSFDVVVMLFRQELAYEIIAVLVEVKKRCAGFCSRQVFCVIIVRLDDFS